MCTTPTHLRAICIGKATPERNCRVCSPRTRTVIALLQCRLARAVTVLASGRDVPLVRLSHFADLVSIDSRSPDEVAVRIIRFRAPVTRRCFAKRRRRRFILGARGNQPLSRRQDREHGQTEPDSSACSLHLYPSFNRILKVRDAHIARRCSTRVYVPTMCPTQLASPGEQSRIRSCPTSATMIGRRALRSNAPAGWRERVLRPRRQRTFVIHTE